MERVPISYEIHMREFDNSLDEILEVDDALPEQDPFAQFVERAEASFNRAGAVGDDAWLRKIGAAPYRPPSDENLFGNPSLIDHPTILSKKIENTWDMPIIEDDPNQLAKSARLASVREFVRRKLSEGETISSLAEYAEQNGNSDHAKLIRTIGAEL